jgi:O-antigen/teichoic acid export membrane protein
LIKGIKKIDGFGRNIILVFLGTSLVNLFSLLYQLFIAHSLTAQDFAAFNSLLSLFVWLSSPLITLQTAVAKFGAEFRSSAESEKTHTLLVGLLKKSLPLALITFLAFTSAGPLLAQKLKIPPSASGAGIILALLLASSWVSPILLGGIQGLELFGWYTLVVVISAALKLIFSFVFIRSGFEIPGALFAFLLASLIGIGISFLPLRDCLFSRTNRQEVDFREILTFAFPVAFSLFSFVSLVNMDMVLVKYYFSPLDSGFYSLAQMTGKIFIYLPTAVSIVLLPRTSGLKAKNEETASTLKKSLGIGFLLCLAAALCYNLFPRLTLRLLTGKAFPESIFLGRLFSVSMTFFSLLFILITYFLSIRDFRFIKYLAVLTSLQFLGISFFHHNLVQVQLILCTCSFLLFSSHFLLIEKRPKVSLGNERA